MLTRFHCSKSTTFRLTDIIMWIAKLLLYTRLFTMLPSGMMTCNGIINIFKDS
jgi:hypothetical protein